MSKTNQKISKPKMYVFAAVAVLAVGGGILSYALYSPQATNDKPDSQSNQVAVNQSTRVDSSNAYASISDSDIQHTAVDADLIWQPDKYQVVALVHVDSIEGGRTYNPVLEACLLYTSDAAD